MTTTHAYKQNRPVDAFTTSSINWKKNCVESWKKILEQKLKTGKKKRALLPRKTNQVFIKYTYI